MRDSILLGLGTGAAGGAAIGNAIGGQNDPSGLWKGAVVGGLVGGIAGYVIHNGLEQRDASTRRDTLFNLEKYDVSRPAGSESNGPNITIAPPNVETECYETQVRGNKLIQSHCESSIVGTPEWVLPQKERTK